jgi:hypothetical protein
MLLFYEPLGFRVERKTGPFVVLNGFGIRLFIAEKPDAPTGKRWTNIRIIVDDIDLIWVYVNAIGLPIVHEIQSRS